MKPDHSGLSIIIGLGNPGTKYEKTRHNAGFLVIEEIARTISAKFRRTLFNPWLKAEKHTANGRIVLIKPLTYMNASGRIIKPLFRQYSANMDTLTVIYDTLDLPPGVIRIRPSGSGGGQRGIASIIEFLGSDRFKRIAVGIGHPGSREGVIPYVLSNPEGEELTAFQAGISRAAEAASALSKQPVETVMNSFNGKN